MVRLLKLLAKVETDEDPDFDNEDNGSEDVLEEIFLIMKVSANMIRNRKRTEILEMKMLELFSSEEGIEWRKTEFSQNIRSHNIVSHLPGTKGPAKDVTSPVKSWELFIHDNIIQLIVE
ncbi:hypothetical protein AVEN_172381-1 [Araneus ventricosus]|uniref:Uncharacterized protein n=1 Tax=Araneus ventricosus TaxID=182803 RepID=A0A4Y2WSX5_ARAVE|nr:hypothetical protein AVEN_213531-1 [Araneus ventricosus]GBO39260.1 hypothetical protein AVEN_145771-1 [Araneus ventricosus]GBO39261.1 hypothetical protein AVEN_150037-1 [Araneus ventricosus]GBO39262.1 hypothetical protein AVEN_172381-1 [Araneus ventricosus]